MDGRRVFHARGKVLGGSSSINGMIFQRGNPLDYERWAADQGMEDWDYAALPALLQADGDLPRRRRRLARRHGPLVLERGPATNPLFGAFFEAVAAGRLPADRRRQRLPPGGLRARSTATSTAAAGSAPPAPTCTRCLTGRTSRVETLALVDRVRVRGQPRGRRRLPARRRGCTARVEAGEVILCGGAINSPQLLQLSGVGDRALTSRALGIDVVARPARRRREPAGPPRGLHPVRLASSRSRSRPGCKLPAQAADRRRVAVPPHAASARPTTSRAAASSAATTTSTTRT